MLEQNAPELLANVSGVREWVLQDGALSLKVKTLMTMLSDALLAHSDGVAAIADRARAAGASEEEIAETVGVARAARSCSVVCQRWSREPTPSGSRSGSFNCPILGPVMDRPFGERGVGGISRFRQGTFQA